MDRLLALLDGYLDAPVGELADREAQIWRLFGADAAALVLDMSGFSLTVRTRGLVHYMALARRMQHITRPIVEAHGGSIVKYEADNLFAHFPEPAAALAAATGIRAACVTDGPADDPRHIRVSIGIAHGRMLVLNGDFFGDCVNVAAKLAEDIAGPDEILVDATAASGLTASALSGAERITASVSGIPLNAWRLPAHGAPARSDGAVGSRAAPA